MAAYVSSRDLPFTLALDATVQEATERLGRAMERGHLITAVGDDGTAFVINAGRLRALKVATSENVEWPNLVHVDLPLE